jgi:trimeric autotransporter adhesin
MSTQVQYRRGTSSQNNAFTGALAEITVDTTNWTLRVHDGVTAGGGGNLATVAYVNAQIGSLSADSISNGTSNVKVLSSGGNIAMTVGGSGIVTFASSGILNDMGNGVGNIGNATGYFNTIFAKATSAQYADVAEKYVADQPYPAGTVLEIGGTAEVRATTEYATARIAGVVSSHPALIMNSGETSSNAVEVALLGRVPCRVTGTIRRGDLLVASTLSGVATTLDPTQYQPGSVIGKALANYDDTAEGMIEVLVGRL